MQNRCRNVEYVFLYKGDGDFAQCSCTCNNLEAWLYEVDPTLMTLSIVNAIQAKYPSLRCLYIAYQKCKDDKEREYLIFNNVKVPDPYEDISQYDEDIQNCIKFLKTLGYDHNANMKEISIKCYEQFGKT